MSRTSNPFYARSPHVWLVALLAAACSSGASDAGPDGGSGAGGAPSMGAANGAGGASGGASASAGSTSAGASSPAGSGGTTTSGGAAGATSAGTTSAGASTGGASGTGGSAAGAGGAVVEPKAFKGVANSDCADLTRLGASWWYNWVTSPGSCKTGEFVPMIAGKSEKTPETVASTLTKIKAAGYRTVLGFNEPNKADQSNLTVETVVSLWPSLTSDPELRVGSPATSADAKAWFESFMAQVEEKQLRVDFVAIHWYGWNAGSCNDAKELEGYITWAEKFERPIWITEFGCLNASNPTPEVVQGFYASALEALARHPSVERYAWYPWTKNNELVASGNLTALGTAFAAAAKTR